jgi:two-component system cell cycle response regulator DivK
MRLFCDLLGRVAATSPDARRIEALKLTRQLKPDLIIMDIQLPDVSGLEVTK